MRSLLQIRSWLRWCVTPIQISTHCCKTKFWNNGCSCQERRSQFRNLETYCMAMHCRTFLTPTAAVVCKIVPCKKLEHEYGVWKRGKKPSRPGTHHRLFCRHVLDNSGLKNDAHARLLWIEFHDNLKVATKGYYIFVSERLSKLRGKLLLKTGDRTASWWTSTNCFRTILLQQVKMITAFKYSFSSGIRQRSQNKN